MAARDGMENLILRLRSMTHAASDDYYIGDTGYWSDDQLQDRLDQYRTDLNRVQLRDVPEYTAGNAVYYDYYAPYGEQFEESDSGAEAWQVEDSDGDAATVVTDYAVNYINGHIRFTSDQDGATWYLRARAYDLDRAAAAIWHEKAAHYAERFDISTDNHRLSRSQLIKHCLDMAARFDGKSGVTVGLLWRRDVLP